MPESSPASAPSRAHRDRSLLAILAGACALGAVPRLWRLPAQLLGGDEMHAVRAVLRHSGLELLTTFQQTDNCIPLSALTRALMDLGVPLSEMLLRAPSVLAGLLALVLLPLLARPLVPRATVVAFAFTLALSPALILYSRIARPYLPALLLVALGGLACERFWRVELAEPAGLSRSGRWRAAVGYCLAAAGAAWLLLPAAPAAAAPLLCSFAAALRRDPERRRRLARACAMALGLALAVGAWLLPALPSLVSLVGAKRIEQVVPIAVWMEALRWLAGTAHAGVAALFWALALVGLLDLLRRRPGLGLSTAAIVLGQAVAIRVLSPMGLGNPLILGRYLLPVLPFVLLWVAHALALPWRREATVEAEATGPLRFLPARRGWGLAALAAAAALVLSGPLTDLGFWRTSYLGHNDFVRFTRPSAELPSQAIPEIYRRLARELPDGPVIEALWPSGWAARTPYIYQDIHRREVLLGVTDRAVRAPETRWRNLLAVDANELLPSRARYLILHLDPLAEESRVRRAGQAEPAVFPEGYRAVLADLPRLLRRLRRALGPPLVSDGVVRVWDLELVRQRGSDREVVEAPPRSVGARRAKRQRRVPPPAQGNALGEFGGKRIEP